MPEPPDSSRPLNAQSLPRAYAAVVVGLTALVTLLAGALVVVWRRGQANRPAEPAPAVQPVAVTAPASALALPAPSVSAPVGARRAAAAAGLTLLACLLMLISATVFAEARFPDWPEFFGRLAAAAIPFAAGIVVLGVAVRRSPYRAAFALPALAVTGGRVVWPGLGLGVALLAVGTVLAGRVLRDMPPISVHLQFVTLLASFVLIAWALSGAPRHFPRLAFRSARREVALVALLTGIALFLRLIEVRTMVPGLIDEVHPIDGVWFVGDPNAGILRQVSTFLSVTLMHSYWTYLSVNLFGQSLESLRFPSAVIGALYVPAVYLMARELFNRRTAVAAALLILTFPLHMHYSRIAFWHISDPLFAAWAVALFAVALRRGSRWAWVWGGVALGMTQYFFEAGRLVVPPLILVWFGWLLITRWRGMKPHLKGMGLALLMAALVAAPVYVTMAANGAPFANRFNDSGGLSSLLQDLGNYGQLDPYSQYNTIKRIFNPLLIYMALPDSSGTWYGAGQPMVLPILVPLLLLGVAHSLWRLRAPGIIVLGAVLAISVGGATMLDNVVYVRYIISTPFIPVLMAVGLAYTAPMLWPRLGPPGSLAWRRAGRWAVPGVALAGALLQLGFYFGPFRTEYAVTFRAGTSAPDAQDAVFRVAELPDAIDFHPIIVTRIDQDLFVARTLFTFLTNSPYPLDVIRADEFTAGYLAQLPRDRDYAFFLEPADVESYRRLADAFRLGPPQYSTQPLLPAVDEYLMFVVRSRNAPPG